MSVLCITFIFSLASANFNFSVSDQCFFLIFKNHIVYRGFVDSLLEGGNGEGIFQMAHSGDGYSRR